MKQPPPCPVCHGDTSHRHLSVEDHSVSHETFQIRKCADCQFRFTYPIPADLAKYYLSDAYVSHAEHSSNIIDHTYRFARTFTLRWKYALINKYCSGPSPKLLDYGCGTGTFLKYSQQQGMVITGIEPSPIARKVASQLTKTTVAASLNEIGIADYDVITLWHVLEHVADIHETLQSLHSKLANAGLIFIAVPNYKSDDAEHYNKYWAAYDVPRHLWHFSQDTMGRLLRTHGFTLDATVPMKLDAFYVSLLSEKYKNGGKATAVTHAKGMINGLKSNISAASNKEYSSLIYIARK
ncbi:MAG: class I SAM-dependent methyltransferase [Chryseolinea sp.]